MPSLCTCIVLDITLNRVERLPARDDLGRSSLERHTSSFCTLSHNPIHQFLDHVFERRNRSNLSGFCDDQLLRRRNPISINFSNEFAEVNSLRFHTLSNNHEVVPAMMELLKRAD